jgi:hypothetical protein
MTRTRARRLLLLFIVLFAVAVTWPGIVPANRFRPTVFGLPFTLVWVALWIVIGFALLLWVDRRSHADDAGPDGTGRS